MLKEDTAAKKFFLEVSLSFTEKVDKPLEFIMRRKVSVVLGVRPYTRTIMVAEVLLLCM